MKALSRREFIGEDRADVSRQKAAVGVMSSMAKLERFDATKLLPNPPRQPELTLEQQAAMFESFAVGHNAKWQRNQSER